MEKEKQWEENNCQIKKVSEYLERREITSSCKYLKWIPSNKDKEKIRKEYLRRIRKLLETKLGSKNPIKRINTWVDLLVRFSWPFLKWMKKELRQMDQRKKKLITIHKALHPRDDIDYICQEKEEGDLPALRTA